MKAGNYLGSDDQHIVENENFRKVDPEKDLKRWQCKKSTAVVASSTLKLIQPVVPVVNVSTNIPVSTTCTISNVPSTVSYSPPRIVLDNNIADQLIALSEEATPHCQNLYVHFHILLQDLCFLIFLLLRLTIL
jgi:hypothetical protein